MSRNDNYKQHNNNKSRNWKNKEYNNNKKNEPKRQFVNHTSQKEIQENERAIKEFKSKPPVCEICKQPILEVSAAINNSDSNNPVHFDCVLTKLVNEEKPGQNEKVTYIGQGRFAVLHFDNIHDLRHFTIKKIIEWEKRDAPRSEWRDKMAGLYSQVK